MARLPAATVVLVAAVCLAGCATTWPPFTSDPAAPYTTECSPARTPLENATRRACLMQQAYADAMGRAASFQRNNNIALFGLGAATAGLALTGTTGVPLIALALATAAGFTGNELFVPARAHVDIFEVGARASGCMWSLGNDYLAAAGKLDDLKNARGGLARARDELAKATGELNRVLGGASDAEQATEEWKTARRVVDDATTAATEAGTVVSALNTQIRGLEVTAASELDRALSTIRVAIKKAAVSTIPDTSTVMNAVRAFQADIPAAYTGLVKSRIDKTENAVGAHAQAKSSAEKAGLLMMETDRGQAIKDQVDNVKTKLDVLRAEVSNARNISDQAAVPNAQVRLQECIGIAQSAPEQKHVKVNPSVAHVKPGATEHVAVSGGIGPYRPAAIGVDPSKVALTMGTPDASKVADLQIKPASDIAAPSRFTIQVSDEGSKLQTPNYIEVWVEAAPQPTPGLKATPKDRSDNKVRPGGTITFTISGGTPPYSSGGVAAQGGAAPDWITIEPAAGNSLPADNALKLTVKANAPAGTVTATVIDKAKAELSIPVEVTATGPTRAGGVATPPGTPEDVRAAQQLLRYRGQDPGPIDGDFGPRTRSAIENFQKSQGLAVTGTLDRDTRTRLGLSADPVTSQVIADMQARLRDRGLYNAAIDGIPGPATTDATRRFQRANGLEQTGVLDAGTRELLGKER